MLNIENVGSTVRLLGCAVSGCLLSFAFAPYSIWILAIIAYGVLFAALAKSGGIAESAGLSVVFGVSLQFSGHHWLIDALSTQVGWLDPVALLVSLLLAIYMAIPLVLFVAAWEALYRVGACLMFCRWTWVTLLPWVVMISEYARSLTFGGFSSLCPGYAVLDTPLAGLLPLGGVWLAGWGVLYTALAILLLAFACRMCGRLRRGGFTSLTVAVLWVFAWWGADQEWVQTAGPEVRISVLQTAISQQDKFDESKAGALWSELTSLLSRATSSVVVAPETALPQYLSEIPLSQLKRIADILHMNDAQLFIGAPVAYGGVVQNAVVEIGGDGVTGRMHTKAALMPFGEFIPNGFGWLSPLLDIPLKNLSPAKTHPGLRFSVGGVAVGVLICHEDLDASIAIDEAKQSALLLNPTNLAWFDGLAGEQRLQISRVRAAETARPIVRVANGAGSAFIDHRGALLEVAPNGAEVMEGSVWPVSGVTPFLRFGVSGTLLFVSVMQALLTAGYFMLQPPPLKGGAKS